MIVDGSQPGDCHDIFLVDFVLIMGGWSTEETDRVGIQETTEFFGLFQSNPLITMIVSMIASSYRYGYSHTVMRLLVAAFHQASLARNGVGWNVWLQFGTVFINRLFLWDDPSFLPMFQSYRSNIQLVVHDETSCRVYRLRNPKRNAPPTGRTAFRRRNHGS
jgi:hypothetical protein